jgi:hypothetical protein
MEIWIALVDTAIHQMLATAPPDDDGPRRVMELANECLVPGDRYCVHILVQMYTTRSYQGRRHSRASTGAGTDTLLLGWAVDRW